MRSKVILFLILLLAAIVVPVLAMAPNAPLPCDQAAKLPAVCDAAEPGVIQVPVMAIVVKEKEREPILLARVGDRLKAISDRATDRRGDRRERATDFKRTRSVERTQRRSSVTVAPSAVPRACGPNCGQSCEVTAPPPPIPCEPVR